MLPSFTRSAARDLAADSAELISTIEGIWPVALDLDSTKVQSSFISDSETGFVATALDDAGFEGPGSLATEFVPGAQPPGGGATVKPNPGLPGNPPASGPDSVLSPSFSFLPRGSL